MSLVQKGILFFSDKFNAALGIEHRSHNRLYLNNEMTYFFIIYVGFVSINSQHLSSLSPIDIQRNVSLKKPVPVASTYSITVIYVGYRSRTYGLRGRVHY